MIPINGEWTRFSDKNEQLKYFRLWGLIPPKSNTLRPVMVTDGYFGIPEPCTVVGYKEDFTAVIELSDGFHAIFGEYLAEQQPKASQKLPHGMCFAEILSDYIVIDIETTGFDRNNDEILEIAAVKYSYGQEIDSFHTFICPRKGIPQDITTLTGITMDDVSSYPYIESVMSDFNDYVGLTPIVGHNVLSFDIPFLATQLGMEFKNPVIDTLPMSRDSYPLLHSHKLEYLKDALALNNSPSHRALDDVYTTNALLWACLAPRRYESLMWKAFRAHKMESPFVTRSIPSVKKKTRIAKYEAVDIKSIQSTSSNFDTSGPLYEKNIVFTGNLSISREEAMQMAVNAGAVLKSSVSRKTDFLVVGTQDKALVASSGMSSKEIKADELNHSGKAHIQILNEAQFIELTHNKVV